jgi:hypothetical protein
MNAKTMPHPNHEKHLCYLDETGYIDQFPEAFKELIRGARYMCRACGRSAADKQSLCVPERL